MKKIVQFSVDYPVTILMLVLGVLLLGYISFSRLGMDLFPEMQSPRIYVEVTSGERPPEEMERQFVENVEALSSRQKGAVHVSSLCRVGSARVTVEYAWGTDMDAAFLDLQKTLGDLKQNPAIDELTVSRQNPNATPIIVLGLSNPTITDMDELRKTAENYIRNELVRLEGIAEVKLLGEEEKEVLVETDEYLLEAHGLTQTTVASRIQDYNRSISGGSLVEMGTKYVIKGVGEFSSIDDISHVVLAWIDPAQADAGASEAESGSQPQSEKVPVFLQDIARLSLSAKKPDNIVRLDGERCMALAIYKETRYNTVKAVEQFHEALGTLQRALPGYELTVIENRGHFITEAVSELEQSGLIGILLAVVVLLVFLRRIGATLIISVAIPISIVATFNLMFFNGLTLNIMTLGGLALGAGMLVDNAIVVMENISRHLEDGVSLRESSVLGTSQVGGAITASTITTVVVFLPIIYLQGFAGELFKDQAWTVAFSLVSSLVVAILVMPMLSTHLLKIGSTRGAMPKTIGFSWYPRLLARLLDYRWAIIMASVGLIALTAALVPRMGSEFIPRTNLDDFTIDLRLPEGTELYRTAGTVEGIEKQLNARFGADIRSLYSIAGKWRDTDAVANEVLEDENTATIRVMLNPARTIATEDVIAETGRLLAGVPDLECSIYQEQTTMMLSSASSVGPVVVEIHGEDLDWLQKLTGEARTRLDSVPGLYSLETSFDQGRPEVEIVLDRVRAGLYDVSVENVSNSLQNVLSGAEAGTWDTGGEQHDITVKLPQVGVSQIENLQISQGDRTISLYELARIRRTRSPATILRENQERTGKVYAHLAPGVPIDKAVHGIQAALEPIDFPPRYGWRITGEEQQRQESFSSLKFALILSLILVYMVLASQFESLLHPFTIVLSIPLAFVGAVGIFLILGRPLNIMAFIGIIMLAGIAVNNSIILVDAIGQLRREGMQCIEAVIEAGRRRIRPILMTSLTTILALLPLTLGFGESASLRSPMALAVIGGLVTSTLLTLAVVPCLYLVLDRLGDFLTSGRQSNHN